MKTKTSKRLWLGMLAMVPVFGMMFTGCGSLFGGRRVAEPQPPASFQRGTGGETTILLRQDLDFDLAFREVLFILQRHGFEPEMMQPEVGFIRTRWIHTWNEVGVHLEAYRVRILANFNPSRTQLIINAEGEWLQGGQWIRGFDTRAIETLHNDLNMIIGN